MEDRIKQYPYKIICLSCGIIDGMGKDNINLSHLRCFSCKKSGTSTYIKEGARLMKQRKWKQNDRVVVDFDGKSYAGFITDVLKTKARVLFDDGDVDVVRIKDLKPEENKEDDGRGFHQYEIKWDKSEVNFKFKAEEAQFHGWWRKVQAKGSEAVYGIDLMVTYEDHQYNVDTLYYYGKDPRENLSSLDADICAAANKWFYRKCKGTFDTIEDLQQRAEKPTIRISHLQTLDKIILDLKEYRDTAIRCGGRRIMMFTGDEPDTDPSMRVEMDLTKQAFGLKGRVPVLGGGIMLDEVAKDNRKGKKGRGSKQTQTEADPQNIKALLKKLDSSKDKGEQRKIRATLRRLGHTGGGRSKTK